jgi:hypothetical protein
VAFFTENAVVAPPIVLKFGRLFLGLRQAIRVETFSAKIA